MHWLQEARAFLQDASYAAAPDSMRRLLVGAVVSFALRWRCCRFRFANWKGLANSIRDGVLIPSLPFLMPSHKGTPSRGTPQLGETYRDVRLVLRSAPVACRRLGGFATGRLLTMAWWAVGGGALSFDRTNACTQCRRPSFERERIRLTGSAAAQPALCRDTASAHAFL